MKTVVCRQLGGLVMVGMLLGCLGCGGSNEAEYPEKTTPPPKNVKFGLGKGGAPRGASTTLPGKKN